MPGGATCGAELNFTQYDNSAPNTDGCAVSWSLSASYPAASAVQCGFTANSWIWLTRSELTSAPLVTTNVYRPRADWSQKLVRQERFVHRHSSWQVLVLLPSAVSQLGQECIWGPVLFVTTYQCEQSFSVMIVVKNEQRNRLEAIFPHDMRLVLWNVWITELAASKQALCPTKSKNSKKTISWMCVTESKKEIKGPGRLKLEGYGALLETDDSGTLRNAGLSSTHCSCTVT